MTELEEMKSQYRKDAELRISKGSTASQQLRHALYELWMEMDSAMKPAQFDVFYADKIEGYINGALNLAEDLNKKKQELAFDKAVTA